MSNASLPVTAAAKHEISLHSTRAEILPLPSTGLAEQKIRHFKDNDLLVTRPSESRSAFGSGDASGNIYVNTGVDVDASVHVERKEGPVERPSPAQIHPVPTPAPFLSSPSSSSPPISSSTIALSPTRSYNYEHESHLQDCRHQPQLMPTSTKNPMSSIRRRSSDRALNQQQGRPHTIAGSELLDSGSGDRFSAVGSIDNDLVEGARDSEKHNQPYDSQSSIMAAVALVHVSRSPAVRSSSASKRMFRLAPKRRFSADRISRTPNPLPSSQDLSTSLMVGNEERSYNGMATAAATLTTATAPSTTMTPPFKAPSARGTPGGLLSMDVQISLLASVLKHDPFNCPIRRTTQVWERISKEQGVRARTCAQRYDSVIQSSIAGRNRHAGTEEQITTKKKLLDQVFEMMNQPQAVVRMQKKRRYRSEEADRSLLLEVVRLNPFAQKVGQVTKVWEDVRGALGMKVHARQCMRRVNRIIKQYQLRERVYNGNIPEDMQEANDELVKEVVQLVHLGGHGGSLEDDEGQLNGEDSASDISYPEDQEDAYMGFRVRKRNVPPEEEEPEDEDMASQAHPGPTTTGYPKLDGNPTVDSALREPWTRPSASAASDPPPQAFSGQSRLARKPLSRNPIYGSTDRRKALGINVHKDKSVRGVDTEFWPQRIWESHPYSQEATARSSSRLLPQKGQSSPAGLGEAVNTGGGRQRPTEHWVEGSSGSLLRVEPGLDMGQIQSPLSDTLQTTTSDSSSLHGPGYHQPPTEYQSLRFIEPAPQLYRTVLNEFQDVRGYLDRLDGQRRRDKDNQRRMHQMIGGLQRQMQEQQTVIRDLQCQMEDRQRRAHPRSQHTDQSTSHQARRDDGEHHLSLAVHEDEAPADDPEQSPQ